MFKHLFVNRLKILVRDKLLLFWSLIFPLILGTFFFLAFSNLSEDETFKPIDVAVVNNQQYNDNIYFKTVLNEVSKGNDKLFNLQEINENEAKDKLEKGEISGYIINDKLVVKKNSINETIIIAFLDQYNQRFSTVSNLMNSGAQLDFNSLQQIKDYTKDVSYGNSGHDNNINYFYTLIAMTCLYAGFWGVKEIEDIQANQSPRARRINIAPIHKLKILVYNLCATFVISFLSIMILMVYLIFVLKLSFGNQIGFILLTTVVGTLSGMLLGLTVGAVYKKGNGMKIAILMTITLGGCLLAGMMYAPLKYMIITHIPFVQYINPVNMLTDALYSLDYYTTYNKFFLNIGLLTIMNIIFLAVTYFTIRRQKYESI